MSRVGIAHHHSAITVGGAHPTATFSWTFVSQRLMTVHPKMPLLTHPHPFDFSQGRPYPPLEGEGNSLSLRERVRPALREVEGVRVGISYGDTARIIRGYASDSKTTLPLLPADSSILTFTTVLPFTPRSRSTLN